MGLDALLPGVVREFVHKLEHLIEHAFEHGAERSDHGHRKDVDHRHHRHGPGTRHDHLQAKLHELKSNADTLRDWFRHNSHIQHDPEKRAEIRNRLLHLAHEAGHLGHQGRELAKYIRHLIKEDFGS